MAYNKTQLNPDDAFERHVYHRDQFAHFLRWSFILDKIKPSAKQKILDYGCGISGNLAEVLYRNRHKAEKYLGLDIRKLDKARDKFKNVTWIDFKEADLVKDKLDIGNDWDIITSFEVIEHIGKHNTQLFLENIKQYMNKNTILYLSTPNYDEQVGAAENHIIDGEVGEFEFYELYAHLSKHFKVEKVYATFASQKDYRDELIDWKKDMFEQLNEYYDANLVSVIMAPLIQPQKGRNCLWVLKLK